MSKKSPDPIKRKFNLFILTFSMIFSIITFPKMAYPVEATKQSVQSKGEIRVGVTASPEPLAIFVAQKKGFFETNGVKANIRVFDTATVGLSALGAGEVDAATINFLPATVFIAKGGDSIILTDLIDAPGRFRLIARREIKSSEDLKGKNIGVAIGTGGHYLWLRYLERYGIKENEVQIKNIGAPESIALLCRGDISAFYLWEPFPTKAIEACPGEVHQLSRERDNIPVLTLLVANGQFSKNNPKIITALLKSITEGVELISKNREEAAEVLSGITRMDLKSAETLLGQYKYRAVLNRNTLTGLQDMAKFLKQLKMIEATPDWGKLVKPEYLKEISPKSVQ